MKSSTFTEKFISDVLAEVEILKSGKIKTPPKVRIDFSDGKAEVFDISDIGSGEHFVGKNKEGIEETVHIFHIKKYRILKGKNNEQTNGRSGKKDEEEKTIQETAG